MEALRISTITPLLEAESQCCVSAQVDGTDPALTYLREGREASRAEGTRRFREAEGSFGPSCSVTAGGVVFVGSNYSAPLN